MDGVNTIPNIVVERCLGARRIAVLTGAGISAESGVPTFRDRDGLWTKLNPQELAFMEAFLKNPQHVWEWYQSRRKVMQEVKPNPAHYTLAAMEDFYPVFSIATQNIDGLHQRAGSRKVFELHGNIERNRCSVCGRFVELPDETAEPPRCSCGGLIRPDVVWFGEMLPEEALDSAAQAARTAEVYFSIGTSAQVFPAAQLPYDAAEHGAFLVEINAEPTALTPYAHISLQGKAGEILPRLWRAISEKAANG